MSSKLFGADYEGELDLKLRRRRLYESGDGAGGWGESQRDKNETNNFVG